MTLEWVNFSDRAMQAIKYSDAFINIYEGAVRSSKTVSSIVAWLTFIEDSPYSEFLITGKTENTCYRNIIGGTYGILGILGEKRAKFTKSGDGGTRIEIKVRNRHDDKKRWVWKTCYVVGANDDKSENKIRGMTIAGWYADEVTLYPQSFVTQAINRMSLDGARAFWTCNPDSPYHYIKEDFIDKANTKGYRVFHFTLDDNKSLSQRYKDNLKKAYKGLWYKRMVLGLWVMAEGVIYDIFNHDPEHMGGMVVAKLPPMVRYWVGVDYGQSNATVFLLMGEGNDGKCYIIDEYYHSGAKTETLNKTPSQYAEDFVKFIDRDIDGSLLQLDKIFIDPSAKGFILELYNCLDNVNRRKIQPAFNDVAFGIQQVSSLMGNDGMRVHVKCKNVLRELASYVWSPTAQKNGRDAPTKKNDHTMDSLRYAIVGTRKIWVAFIRQNRDKI